MNRRKKGSVFQFSRTVAKAMFENTMQDRRLERSNKLIDKTKHRARCDINSQIYALRAEMLRIRACTPSVAEAIMENALVPLEERGKDPSLRKKLKPKGKEDQFHIRMNSATNKHAMERMNAITGDAPYEPEKENVVSTRSSPSPRPPSQVHYFDDDDSDIDAPHKESSQLEQDVPQISTILFNKKILRQNETDTKDLDRPESPRKTDAKGNRPASPKKTVIIQSQSMYEFKKSDRKSDQQRPASSLCVRTISTDRPRSAISTTTRSNTPTSRKVSTREKLEIVYPNRHAHLSAARIHRKLVLTLTCLCQKPCPPCSHVSCHPPVRAIRVCNRQERCWQRS